MNITELQLGNLVWEDYGGVSIITGVNLEASQVWIKGFRASGEKTISSFYSPERIEPILFDKLWFERFGFTPTVSPDKWERIIYPVEGIHGVMVQLTIDLFAKQTTLSMVDADFDNILPVQHIEFLHQYQNFIQAYTGEGALIAIDGAPVDFYK